MRRIGLLMVYAESDPEGQTRIAAIRNRLQQLGWVEGRNLRIDYRWGALDAASRQQFAQELVALHPDLILSQDTPTTASLLEATRTIPIVFMICCPIRSAWASSRASHGRAATSPVSSIWKRSIAGKWVELLKEIAPLHYQESPSCSILTLPPRMPRFTWTPSRLPPAPWQWKRSQHLFTTRQELELCHLPHRAREANAGLIVMPDAIHSASIAL